MNATRSLDSRTADHRREGTRRGRPPGERSGRSAFRRLLDGGLLLAVLAALLLPAGAGAQEADGQEADGREPMTLVDILEVPRVYDPRIAPDGEELLYVRSDADWEENGYVSHIWRVGSDGSDPIRLTNGEEGESSPRWSPDGSLVAFLAEREGVEHRQVWLLRSDGGEAWNLTEHATPVSSIEWSPDGEWIHFLAADEEPEAWKEREEKEDDVYPFEEDYRHRHLWRVRVSLDGQGEEERITDGDHSVTSYRLSRDGSMIVFQRGPNPLLDDLSEREVWVMAADGSDERRITRNGAPEGDLDISPDNSRVLFTCFCDSDFEFYYNDNLFVADVDGGEPRNLTGDRPFEVNSATWADDGRSIYVAVDDRARSEIYRIDAGSGEVEALTEGEHSVGSWSYSPAARTHVFTLERPGDPGDVRTLPADGGTPRKVTSVFDYVRDEFRIPRQELVTWEGEDGVEVEGLLYYPLDYREGIRHPLVVQTHGGPASSDTWQFGSSWDYTQKLAAMGYFVLQPNYRGSTGYGDDFLRDMVPGYFDQAHRDVMAGVDHLIEEGLVDGERMAKMGWSAGGHMTNKVITHTDRFAAASSGAGAANWVSMYAQSDVRIYRTPWFGGSPWQEDSPLEMYREHSPIFDVGKVTTPTLVLVGENDPRVPMPQSVELYRGLSHNGVPTHLYVAPREPHGWRELRHRLFKANVELDWFERWVRDREYEWEKAPGDESVNTGVELLRGNR